MSLFLKQYQSAITKLAQKHNISYLAVFGSQARGDANPDSDVDFIVDFSKRKSLFDVIQVESEFEELLGKKVEMVTERSLKPLLRDQINKDKQVLFYDQNQPRLYQRYPESYQLN